MTTLGFDTSNYTTSVAYYGSNGCANCGKLLDVPAGELGLRQSDALFMHVKRLPELAEGLAERLDAAPAAIGASTQPREIEGSYMPCFLAGAGQARAMAALLKIPFFPFSHQQGHIAAAAVSSGRPELLDSPLLAWHLSGGTTELLLVKPAGKSIACTCIGGTSDISAGQLIDRTGKLLGLDFPAGKALDALADPDAKGFSVKLNELSFSLSGVENKVKQMAASGAEPSKTAGFVLATIASAIVRTTEKAFLEYGELPILLTGGVASNSMLRKAMPGAVTAPPEYCTDNALGIAVLAWRALGE